MKKVLRKIICLVIAFMMIIPAIPGNYAVAAQVIQADKIYKKDIDFTSTNKQSNLQGFWKLKNDVYFAISILHAKTIVSASYISSDTTKTVTGSAIQHLEGITRIEVNDKSNDKIFEFRASKENNQKFVIISFKNIEIEDDFDLQIEIDHGNGHEFDSVELTKPEPEVEEPEGEEPEGEEPEGEEPEGEEPEGEEPEGEEPEGEEPEGEEPEVEEPEGEEPKGEEPEGEEPKGEEPEGEEPKGEEPEGEEPKGEEPKGEEPKGEEAKGEEPKGEEPEGEEPEGEEPEGEEPEGEEPKGEEPEKNDQKYSNDKKDDNKKDNDRIGGGTIIDEPEIPLAQLEKTDHFAYAIGYPEGVVKPLNKITREEVAMIFYRLLTDESRNSLLSETNTFNDMDSRSWSNRAVSTLYNANIIKGYPDGTFRPSAPITRAEFATIAAKFDNLELGNSSKFTDIAGHWAEDYIISSEIKGWIKGYPDLTFKPYEDITRAEAMSLINNVLGRKVSIENIHTEALPWTDIKETDWYYSIIMEATNSHDYIIEEDGDELWTGLKVNKVWL